MRPVFLGIAQYSWKEFEGLLERVRPFGREEVQGSWGSFSRYSLKPEPLNPKP